MLDDCYLFCSVSAQAYSISCVFFCQAEDGIRDLVRSRGLGDVYKRQEILAKEYDGIMTIGKLNVEENPISSSKYEIQGIPCLLYTSDAADERSSVDLGGRRIIKKKTKVKMSG